MSTRLRPNLADRLALRYRTPLISYFRRRGVDPEGSEDLAHEVFSRVSRRSMDGVGNPEAYVFSSASSVYVDHVRRQKTHFAGAHDDIAQMEFESEAPSPLRVLEGKDALRRLGVVLEEL